MSCPRKRATLSTSFSVWFMRTIDVARCFRNLWPRKSWGARKYLGQFLLCECQKFLAWHAWFHVYTSSLHVIYEFFMKVMKLTIKNGCFHQTLETKEFRCSDMAIKYTNVLLLIPYLWQQSMVISCRENIHPWLGISKLQISEWMTHCENFLAFVD